MSTDQAGAEGGTGEAAGEQMALHEALDLFYEWVIEQALLYLQHAWPAIPAQDSALAGAQDTFLRADLPHPAALSTTISLHWSFSMQGALMLLLPWCESSWCHEHSWQCR